jgi:hypothetical protein
MNITIKKEYNFEGFPNTATTITDKGRLQFFLFVIGTRNKKLKIT